MYRLTVLLIFMLITFSSVGAQDGFPLPEDLQPITPANAAQVQQLASIGGDLPGGLAWSPDGKLLAVGTSAGVKVYDAEDLGKAPTEIAGGQDVLFSPDGGRFLSGGKLWDTKTWQSVATIGDSESRAFSPSGKLLVTSRTENGLVVVQIWDADSGASRETLDTQSDLAFVGAVFSPDESHLAVELQSYSLVEPPPAVVQVWNVQSGQQVSTLVNDFDVLDHVHFIFDGQVLLTESYESGMYGNPAGTTILWRVESGQRWIPFEDAFHAVVSQDETLLVFEKYAGSGNIGGMLLSSLEPFQLEYTRPGESIPELISHPIISPDSKTLVIQGEVSSIFIWDIHPEQISPEPQAILANPEYVSDTVFSPDSSILVAEGGSGKIYLWDMKNQRIQGTLDVQSQSFRAEFSPNGQILRAKIYGQDDRLWDVTTNQELPSVKQDSIYSPDWKQTAYWDRNQVDVTDIRSGTQQVLTVIGDYRGNAAALNPASGEIAFTGNGVQIYDTRMGEQIVRLEDDNTSVTFNPEGKHLVTYTIPANFCNPCDYRLWDTSQPDKQPVHISSYSGEPLFSADGSIFALHTFGIQGGGVYELYDGKTGKNLVMVSDVEKDVYSYAFSPDGTLLAGGSYEGFVALWDVKKMIQAGAPLPEGKRLVTDLKPLTTLGLGIGGDGYSTPVDQVVFSPDGKQIAFTVDDSEPGDVASTHEIAYLVNVQEWLRKGGVVHGDDIGVKVFDNMESPFFSADGKYLLLKQARQGTGATSEGLQLINAQTGTAIGSIPMGDLGVFSPDASLIATYGSDGIVLWDVATLVKGEQTPIAELKTADSDIKEVAFSPDGTLLFARSNNRVSVWGVNG